MPVLRTVVQLSRVQLSPAVVAARDAQALLKAAFGAVSLADEVAAKEANTLAQLRVLHRLPQCAVTLAVSPAAVRGTDDGTVAAEAAAMGASSATPSSAEAFPANCLATVKVERVALALAVDLTWRDLGADVAAAEAASAASAAALVAAEKAACVASQAACGAREEVIKQRNSSKAAPAELAAAALDKAAARAAAAQSIEQSGAADREVEIEWLKRKRRSRFRRGMKRRQCASHGVSGQASQIHGRAPGVSSLRPCRVPGSTGAEGLPWRSGASRVARRLDAEGVVALDAVLAEAQV